MHSSFTDHGPVEFAESRKVQPLKILPLFQSVNMTEIVQNVG
ncbi:hypothetical protein SLEP1_g56318 [Rubroshorea leprosula]|uniref:Uncharacterized protein n=1 Tax=Rubroshorea leprosula TaxID=152421 RepID=A0AAV5ML40_9ROSI|nr:hypothetical protein SLEP1_g56318 [Rubroshorea leprosula]